MRIAAHPGIKTGGVGPRTCIANMTQSFMNKGVATKVLGTSLPSNFVCNTLWFTFAKRVFFKRWFMLSTGDDHVRSRKVSLSKRWPSSMLCSYFQGINNMSHVPSRLREKLHITPLLNYQVVIHDMFKAVSNIPRCKHSSPNLLLL